MSDDNEQSVISHLAHALLKIRSTPPRLISSPATQPRRAAVALILRVFPPPHYIPRHDPPDIPNLADFFKLDWVNQRGSRAEILFLHRKKGVGPDAERATKEAHVAFPGGRMEGGDEGGLYTAMRQTWEEIGLDLAERDYVCVGQLDDREITTSLGKRLLMILSPFVFLQVTPNNPPTDPHVDTTLHWISLSSLLTDNSWSNVTVDVASRLAPRHSWVKILVRILVGSMKFSAIVLHRPDSIDSEGPSRGNAGQLKLWGLTLGMTLDLLACMRAPLGNDEKQRNLLPNNAFMSHLPDEDEFIGFVQSPSITSVFPRFSYPDVNFWIWVFGKRYREVIRGWEASMASGGSNDKRINWAGTALNVFYAAVRKALVVVIVLRAIGLLLAISIGGWWVFRGVD